MRDIKFIVVHCTATAKTATIEAIRNYWRTNLKWKSPGYHKIIKPTGEVVTLAPDTAVCNGVAGYNSQSLHVSYIGGIDGHGKGLDTRTAAQIQSLTQVVKDWKKLYPNAIVQGHRDFPNVHKECPSFDARKWWKLAALVLLILVSSCAASKKQTSKAVLEVNDQVKTTAKTDQAKEAKTETETNRETNFYGDSLQGEGFIPKSPEPTQFKIQSTGLEIGLTLTPKFSSDGQLQGYKLDYKGKAKPVGKQRETQKEVKKETVKKHLTTQTQQSTQTENRVTEQHQQEKGSPFTGFLAGAGLVLCIVLALLLWWLIKKSKNER